MSETPRTDAVEAAFLAIGMTPSPGLLDHARKLERELAEVCEALASAHGGSK